MQCPSCKSYQLNPTKIQMGLPGYECRKCGGILMGLLSYRKWAEDYPQLKPTPKTKLTEVEDNSSALMCPKCSRIMLKFRVSGSVENKIDVCSNCDEAWLDSGEWELLEALALQDKLTKVFTDPWQAGIGKERHELSHEQRFIELLEKADYDRISEVKKWIDEHPKKADLIRYLLKN